MGARGAGVSAASGTRMPRSGPWSQVTAHHNLGWVYWTKEDLEQALEQFELTVKIAPRFRTESQTAKAGIVMTLHDMGKTPQAVAYAMKSRMEAVHPRENAEMDLALGRILAREGRLQEAREVLVNAARWPAKRRNGRIELAAVLVLLGRSHEALATIGKENGKLEDLRPIADLMQERGHLEYAGEIRNELAKRAWND